MKKHPQITQIDADFIEFSICGHLRNLWIKRLVDGANEII